MTVEQAVVEHLAADGGVAALVSTRVYQLRLPQSRTLPAVRVQIIDEPILYHLRGAAGIAGARVQVDAFATEQAYSTAVTLGEAIDAALSGQTFSVGSPAFEVVGVFRLDRRVMYEADELQLVRVLQDYWVWARTSH